MKSPIFYTKRYTAIASAIQKFLNSQNKNDLGIRALVRTTGDKIPEILSPEMSNIFGGEIRNFSLPTNRKF